MIKSIELIKRELDSKSEEDPNGEKELAYLQEALKNLNEDEVQHAAREKSKETQYKASCISDKLSKPPGRKPVIKEIITEPEDDQGRTIQTMHRGQLNAQAQINNFYNDLYNHYDCKDEVEDIKKFLGDAPIPQVTEIENERITAPFTEKEVHNFIKKSEPK